MENSIHKIGTTFSFQEIIILCSLSKKKQSLCVTTIQAPTFLNFHSAQGHSVIGVAENRNNIINSTHATNKQPNKITKKAVKVPRNDRHSVPMSQDVLALHLTHILL